MHVVNTDDFSGPDPSYRLFGLVDSTPVVTAVRRLPQRFEVGLLVGTARRPRKLDDTIRINDERSATWDVAMLIEFVG